VLFRLKPDVFYALRDALKFTTPKQSRQFRNYKPTEICWHCSRQAIRHIDGRFDKLEVAAWVGSKRLGWPQATGKTHISMTGPVMWLYFRKTHEYHYNPAMNLVRTFKVHDCMQTKFCLCSLWLHWIAFDCLAGHWS